MPDTNEVVNMVIPSLKAFTAGTGDAVALNDLTGIFISLNDPLPELEEKLEIFIDEFLAVTGVALTLTYNDPLDRVGYITITISDENSLGYIDEYFITAENSGVIVSSPSVQGIFYATRTLLQFAQRNAELSAGTIHDYSDIQERGLMLDVARKYFPVGWLKKMIEQMAALKMNTLQLHLSDNEGFRLETSVDGQKYGVDFETPAVLTKADIADLIQYARARCVNIVPDFDTPGHMAHIVGVLQQHDPIKYANIAASISLGSALIKNNLNIKNALAVQVTTDILDEWLETFDGCEAFHIGGDEYFVTLPLFQLLHHITHDDAVNYLNARGAQVLARNMKVKVWNDEIFRTENAVALTPGTIISYWSAGLKYSLSGIPVINESYATANDLISRGYRLINCNQHYIYYSYNNITPDPEEIYNDWTPLVFAGDNAGIANQQIVSGLDNVQGASYCIWCDEGDTINEETVYQETKLALRATSEKCWAGATGGNDYAAFAVLANSWEPVNL